MNFRTTLFLFVLLLVAVGLYLLTPTRVPEPGTTEPAGPAAAAPVFDPAPDVSRVVRVELRRADRPALVFARSLPAEADGPLGDWRMEAPQAGAADRFRVEDLARVAAQLRSRTRLQPGRAGAPRLADAGLEPPRATLILTDRDDRTYTLEIGTAVPLSTDTYVRVGGDEDVLVATRDFAADLERSAKDYRDRNVLQLRAGDVTAIRVTGPDGTIALARGTDDHWGLAAPITTPAKDREALALVTQLVGVRAADFVEPGALPGTYGFEEPYLTIDVTTVATRPKVTPTPTTAPGEETEVAVELERDERQHRLVIGGAADLGGRNRYARRDDEPAVFIVAAEVVEQLKPELGKLRDDQVTRLQPDDVTALTLGAGSDAVTLRRVDGQWVGDGVLDRLDLSAVAALLQTIADLRATEFIDEPADPASYGLTPPRAVLRVQRSADAPPLTLLVGGQTSSGRFAFAQIEGQPTVFLIGSAAAEQLAVAPLDLRSRAILTLDPARVERVELTRGPQRYVLARGPGGWALAEPAGAPSDGESVRTLLIDLANLRARRVVALGAADEYGLATPTMTVRLDVAGVPAADDPELAGPTTAPAGETHTLRIALRDGTYFCQREGDAYVYELEPTVGRVLDAELIDRRLFGFAADAVVEFKVDAPGGTNQLVRGEAGAWHYPPDPYVKLDAKKVTDFLGELANLRVERYLSYAEADLAAAGLEHTPVTVTVRLADGTVHTLTRDPERRGELPRRAGWVEARRTFLLRHVDVERMLRSVAHYLPSPAEAPPPGPQMPPGPEMPPGPPPF